jgi:chromatin remodeling complex protein RSC6
MYCQTFLTVWGRESCVKFSKGPVTKNLCDDAMRAVFKQDRVHMFTMTKILNQNLYSPDDHKRRRRIVKKQGLVWSLLFHNDQSKSVSAGLFIGILCDDAMRAVFKQDRVHMFTMTKILNQNLYSPDAAITGVLKFVLANVLPNLFDSLGS